MERSIYRLGSIFIGVCVAVLPPYVGSSGRSLIFGPHDMDELGIHRQRPVHRLFDNREYAKLSKVARLKFTIVLPNSFSFTLGGYYLTPLKHEYRKGRAERPFRMSMLSMSAGLMSCPVETSAPVTLFPWNKRL